MKKITLTYLFVFLLLCGGTWLMWVRFDQPLTGIDDANIFFVYAKNFVNGYGFVYNAGGERVEGFSSLLWTLVCVAAFYLSSQPEIILLIFNLVILSLGITAAISYLGSADFVRTGESRRAGLFRSIAFLTLLISFPSYLAWNTISLMENAVWNTLLLLATIFVVRDDISSRCINSIFLPLMVLLLLTRPEAFLWVAVFTAILFWRKTFAQGMA